MEQPEILTEYVRKVDEFWEVYNQATADWRYKWSRGHRAGLEWTLSPQVFRKVSSSTPEEFPLALHEEDILKEYCSRCSAFLRELSSDDYVRKLCHAQHYHLATRLLDWTSDIRVSLYFAFNHEYAEPEDPCVWLLDPHTFNSEYNAVAAIEYPNSQLVHQRAEAAFLGSGVQVNGRHRYPVAFTPDWFEPRLSDQRSCFTIHGSDRRGIDEISISKDGEDACAYLQRIVIPTEAASEFREQLQRTNGIATRAEVFRDPGNIAKNIMELTFAELNG